MLFELRSRPRHSLMGEPSLFKHSWLAISMACLLWALGAPYTLAQAPAERQAQLPLVTAAATSESVRFTAPAKVYEMRLEVFAADGQTLYDSDFKLGNLLDWGLHDQQGQRLADGSYQCVVTVRALYGRASRKQGTVVLQDGQPMLQATQSPQDIKPLNLLAGSDLGNFLALPSKGVALPLTALAHDGQQGRLVSGSGGLSFRTGDFFAGKDVEHMRLTPDGKLGIGVENPQTKLDVAGLIHTSEGIVFPDGSVQTTAYVASGRSLSERAGIQRDGQGRSVTEQGNRPVGTEEGSRLTPNAPASTLNSLAKFINTSGGIGDSIVAESNVTYPKIDVAGTVNASTAFTSNMSIPGNVASNAKQGFWAENILNLSGSPGPNGNIAFQANMYWGGAGYLKWNTNAPGWRFELDAGDSVDAFQIQRVPVGAGSLPASTFMYLSGAGNVGIGTSNPGYKLHVAGGSGTAIYGETNGSAPQAGVYGKTTNAGSYGVWGVTSVNLGYGVFGSANTVAGVSGYGVYGEAGSSGIAVVGMNANTTDGKAAQFNGRVNISGITEITGTLIKPGGSFKIDHPLDPENKFLSHSFVESPYMLNIYNGNVTTDANSAAVVTLPDYFEALNRDFRYQLTVIGTFAQAIIAEEITGNQFKIATSQPNVKVSWQVTGVRQDAWANQHRIPNEELKSESERGYFLHPELYGKDEEKSLDWARNPELMRQLKQQREKAQTQKKPN